MNVAQFKDELKKVYAKYFEGSAITINNKSGLFRSITISCYLIKDQSEAINQITQNDMFRIRFNITQTGDEFQRDEYLKRDDMILPGVLRIEKWSNDYTIKPQSKYLVYSSKDVYFRQTQGNAQKIIDTFEKFIQKLNKQLHDDIKNDLIHDNHIELLKLRLK